MTKKEEKSLLVGCFSITVNDILKLVKILKYHNETYHKLKKIIIKVSSFHYFSQ